VLLVLARDFLAFGLDLRIARGLRVHPEFVDYRLLGSHLLLERRQFLGRKCRHSLYLL